jgi:hypothetical protein
MKRSFAYLFAVAITVIATSSCGDDETPADAGTDTGKPGTNVCGNGKLEGNELCDGKDLNHETCATIGDGLYSKGTLLCSKKCTFDISMCFGEDSGMSDMDDGGGGGGGTGG